MLRICNCCQEQMETNEKKTINYCKDCLTKMKGDENNAKNQEQKTALHYIQSEENKPTNNRLSRYGNGHTWNVRQCETLEHINGFYWSCNRDLFIGHIHAWNLYQ